MEMRKDPYRPIVSIHLDSDRVSFAMLQHAQLLWFESVAIKRTPYEQNPADWDPLRPICQYLFPKVERIVIDNRPYSFLINMYTNFQADSWKFVWVNANIIHYKFGLEPRDPAMQQCAERVASEWMRAGDSELQLAPLQAKFAAYPHRSHVAFCILIYLTFVTPEKHQDSDYWPSLLPEESS